MVHKSCPDCDQQVPVACKACYCGFSFFENKKKPTTSKQQAIELGASSKISSENIIGTKSRRTSRTKRERPDYYSASEYENQIRRLSRASVSSEKSAAGNDVPSSPRKRRGRGRPRKPGNKARLKKETEKPTTDNDVVNDEYVYSNITRDEAYTYSVILTEINEKLRKQWKGPVSGSINGSMDASERKITTSERKITKPVIDNDGVKS